MPTPIPAAVEEMTEAAATKATQSRRVPRYLYSSLLAGVYVGIAVVLMLAVSGPLIEVESAATRLAQGAVFGVALTLVVFAGAELFTGNAMVMVQGLLRGRVSARAVMTVLGLSLAGNLIGSVLLAAVVHGGGTFAATTGALDTVISAKTSLDGGQLFWRAVLCNMLVCLGLWMAARTRSDVAKLVVLWWALLAFVASGFEHSVANMTLFAIGVFSGVASWGDLAHNLAWTLPGNVVGGVLIVGVGYAWLSGPAQKAEIPQGPAEGNGQSPHHQVPAELNRR